MESACPGISDSNAVGPLFLMGPSTTYWQVLYLDSRRHQSRKWHLAGAQTESRVCRPVGGRRGLRLRRGRRGQCRRPEHRPRPEYRRSLYGRQREGLLRQRSRRQLLSCENYFKLRPEFFSGKQTVGLPGCTRNFPLPGGEPDRDLMRRRPELPRICIQEGEIAN